MPIEVSPASYIPGVSLARGSLASEPVIPAGSGGADARANGFLFSWLDGLFSGAFEGSGDGDGEAVCACVLIDKKQHKTSEVNSTRKVMLCTRFIISPPKSFSRR